MSKKINLILLFFCLSFNVFAQSAEKLKLRETEIKYYEKNGLDFRYENTIDEAQAAKINQKLSVHGKAPFVDIYKALESNKNLYFVAGYENRCSLLLYRENGSSLTKIYQSPVFRNAYNLDLKIFENENRAVILAAKREGVGDYIDTEVFEIVSQKVKYLGNIPVGLIEETTGNIDGFADKTEISYQSGNYRIKISGKAYIPAGKKSPGKNTLVGTNIVYVYDGRILRKGR